MRSTILALALVLASCSHKLPVWHGDVDVTPRDRAAIASCGTGALTVAGSAVISREPYLQSTTTTSTTVVWGSNAPRMRIVLTEPGGTEIAAADAVTAIDPERDDDDELEADHEVDEAYDDEVDERDDEIDEGQERAAEAIPLMKAELADLEPGHLYCYQLFADDLALTEPAPLATATAPHPTDHLRFVAVGDTGTGGAAQRAIAKWISTKRFDLLLFLGDVAYRSGTAAQLQNRFFAVYRDFLRYVPAFPVIGNHDRRTRGGRPFLDAFVLPEPERYYSFDWGSVHFVAIDTTRPDVKQVRWLDEDLQRNKLPWVIVFGHHPLHTNAFRGAKAWRTAAFSRVLTDHRVDLVLSGHEHHYERLRFNDVNYVVSGGGGARLTGFYGDLHALAQFTLHHFLTFDVTATKLTMKAIDIQGREIDRLELTKPSAPINADHPDPPRSAGQVDEHRRQPIVASPRGDPDDRVPVTRSAGPDP